MAQDYMTEALAEASAACARGEVPVGAVIVDTTTGTVIARAGNETEAAKDPTAHAEMLAIRKACAAKGAPRLADCDLYVTLEPCPMCAAAISLARFRRVYYGATDPNAGRLEHKAEVYGGMHERECGDILKGFFQRLREGTANERE